MREGRLRLYAKIKIFAQPAGRSRPFSGRSLVLAEGRPMPLSRHLWARDADHFSYRLRRNVDQF